MYQGWKQQIKEKERGNADGIVGNRRQQQSKEGRDESRGSGGKWRISGGVTSSLSSSGISFIPDWWRHETLSDFCPILIDSSSILRAVFPDTIGFFKDSLYSQEILGEPCVLKTVLMTVLKAAGASMVTVWIEMLTWRPT